MQQFPVLQLFHKRWYHQEKRQVKMMLEIDFGIESKHVCMEKLIDSLLALDKQL